MKIDKDLENLVQAYTRVFVKENEEIGHDPAEADEMQQAFSDTSCNEDEAFRNIKADPGWSLETFKKWLSEYSAGSSEEESDGILTDVVNDVRDYISAGAGIDGDRDIRVEGNKIHFKDRSSMYTATIAKSKDEN